MTEHIEIRPSCGGSPTLYFERRQCVAMASNEVNFNISLTPIEDLALSRGSRIRQVCANSGLHQIAPVSAITFCFLQSAARLRRHQRRIEDLKLCAGSPLPDSFTGILLQTTDHTYAASKSR